MVRRPPFFLILAALLASTAPVVAAQILDGWEVFKFGMSPSQVRAIAGESFGRYVPNSPSGQDIGVMQSKNDAVVYGVSYSFNLFFNRQGSAGRADRAELIPSQTLGEISLENEKITSRTDCEKTFLILLSQLEKSYGNLSPVYPQQKKNDQDLLPISLQWKTSQGTSRYQLATVFLPEETAYVWNARKVFDGRYVDAATIWSAQHDGDQSTCLTEIGYKG